MTKKAIVIGDVNNGNLRSVLSRRYERWDSRWRIDIYSVEGEDLIFVPPLDGEQSKLLALASHSRGMWDAIDEVDINHQPTELSIGDVYIAMRDCLILIA